MHKHIISVAKQKTLDKAHNLQKKQANESVTLLEKTEATTKRHIAKCG